MQLFLVKIRKCPERPELEGEYWLASGKGSTPDRDKAYRYSVYELRSFPPSKHNCVLIPVKE